MYRWKSLAAIMLFAMVGRAQDLQLNDLEYFERQGVNVLVFSNSFNGGFNDEKNSGIEIIHHGVRTIQGGAVRLNNTPEQWDLVPKMTNRVVDKEKNSIEVALRYDDYDFDSRVVVTAKGKTVEIAVWLDKPIPEKLAGVNAVLNFGITVCFANLYYPEIIKKDEIYRVANWLYGCHPYHNYSFVAVVGAARPKAVFYGNNRADFSFIPGNVAPGLLFRKPDHFENFDDWPFLWGQNEGTIAGNTQYVIFGSAFKDRVKEK